jgi:RNA recognition motif-containing protein
VAVRLFIGNLPYGASEADLRAYFAPVAEPTHVVMPVDRETGRPRGFAFVEFAERTVAEQIIDKFNAQPFMGRNLAVSEARAREDRPPGPRPGGGFGGPRPGGGFGGPRPGGGFGGPRPGGGGGV